MAKRVTQVTAETLYEGVPKERVTQVTAEVLYVYSATATPVGRSQVVMVG